MPTLVIADRPAHDAVIGLGLAVAAGEPDRLGREQMPTRRDDPQERAPHSSSATTWGGFLVILATRYPLMRWNRSRALKAPDATIASYWSTVIR